VVAEGVERPLNAVLDAPVPLGRDFRLAATVAHILPYGIAVVAAIREQDAGIAVRSSISTL
jgi:hypothetical protein